MQAPNSSHAPLTMQDALLRLTEYWASRGCLVVQPMNTEVGAGTLNPATSLRVLGPEPWRVAYVEPSVRPDDSRYGDSPNRLQTHTQFQVILKPDPGDSQEQYLDSLAALGIDLGRHDVRFVEDNWASPALGAWGLGWEVWLDGLEITQFTYFQQAGGLTLEPVSVEITYGMERIIMALQGVSNFKEITYAPGISYGEAFGQAEYEMSRYYLEDADIDTNRTLFEAYEAEATRLLAARLPVPAHVYVLKCSHAFNVLDSRGAVSPTERARAFARMRGLSHQVAKLWVERREESGHPLGMVDSPVAPPSPSRAFPEIPAAANLAFEIGVEEMPPFEVSRTLTAVEEALTTKLKASRLDHGPIRVVASPRRVVALVEDVQPREPDHEETVRGPRVQAAYDAGGAPTPAAAGFARGQGAQVQDLVRLSTPSGECIGVVRQIPGRPAAKVLAGILPEVVTGLRAEKNMRWNAPGLSFTRPIRWILALLGDQVVPLSVSSLVSGRSTRVHRTAPHPTIEVATADGYLDLLESHGIIADGGERHRRILEGAALASDVGGHIDPVGDGSVVDEVTNLVEEPTVILGAFDQSYLSLPADVLATVMKKHQRYLPVRDAEGSLMPHFIAVANGSCDEDAVRAGNEAVLRARYEDASFFWRNDLRVRPEAMKEKLDRLTFQERLGSVGDRSRRIAVLANALAERVLDLSDEERAVLVRAQRLAKFDLASEMVIELSSLAGVMAREYALQAGEPGPVARALFEMELPRHADDILPTTVSGGLLALADRFDVIAGLFAIGTVPKGSSDPFGLRRAALGIVGILRTTPSLAGIRLDEGLDLAAQHLPVPLSEAARDEALRFVVRRLEQQLLEAGHPHEVVQAVLPLAAAPARAERAAAELADLLPTAGFRALLAAMQRVRRIVPPGTTAEFRPELFETEAERALAEAGQRVQREMGTERELSGFVSVASALVEPIDRFFVDVMVMVEDPGLRANRLGLLAATRDLGSEVLNWAAL